MAGYHSFTDQKLVFLLKAADPHAFDQLYWNYHQRVYKNILRLTKDPEVSQDILQDTFAVLWEKRETLDERLELGNWLFRVSFNFAVNFCKKRLRELILIRPIQEQDDVVDTMDIKSSDIQYFLLSQALEKLSPQSRRAFELCKLDGKTYEQAAAEMSISKHTVKEYLATAKAAIKKFIQDHPGYSETALFLLLVDYLQK